MSENSRSQKDYFDNARLFLEKLGNPQDAHRTIHVAGTSGKGTVCYMVDAIFRAHNKRSALLVSPHVYDIRERIQINGQFIPERHFISLVNEVLERLFDLPSEKQLGYYRLMSTLAFAAASRYQLDYQIVETSLGGSYDTTNTINRDDTFFALTQIGVDHETSLGTTYEQVARTEAMIVSQASRGVVLKQKQAVNTVLESSLKEKSADFTWVEATENYLINDTLLAYQVAKQVADRDGWRFDEEKARLAVNSVYIPGRFEKRVFKDKLIVLDGAHNPQKIRALAWRLNNEDLTPATVVFATGKNKDRQKMIKALQPIADNFICTEFFTEQPEIPVAAAPAEELADIARSYNINQVEVVKDPLEAVRRAASYDNATSVAAGSFYLLGEIDALF